MSALKVNLHLSDIHMHYRILELHATNAVAAARDIQSKAHNRQLFPRVAALVMPDTHQSNVHNIETAVFVEWFDWLDSDLQQAAETAKLLRAAVFEDVSQSGENDA